MRSQKKKKEITSTDEMKSDLSVCSQGYDVKIINTYVLSYIVWASSETPLLCLLRIISIMKHNIGLAFIIFMAQLINKNFAP